MGVLIKVIAAIGIVIVIIIIKEGDAMNIFSKAVAKDKKRVSTNYQQSKNIILASKKILTGQVPASLKKMGISQNTLKSFEESLRECQQAWERLEYRKVLYDEAQKVLHSYYSQDGIYDFMDMLVRFWEKEPRTDMNPIIYAEKGYFNSIAHIRAMFQRMQESYQEMPLDKEFSESKSLELRINMLRDVGNDNASLAALTETMESAEQLLLKVGSDTTPPENVILELSTDADLLQESFVSSKDDKLPGYKEYLDGKTVLMENRNRRILEDVLKSRQLYQMLQDVLELEENNRLMEELNPDNGMLEGENVGGIRDKYQPLVQQIRNILRKFPKNGVAEAP